MDYREYSPPEGLKPLVKLGWSLAIPDDGPEWTVHHATPDGCMEVIRRLAGRSRWRGEQPQCFVAGAISRPAELRIGAGSRFVALRLWPWAWRLIGAHSPKTLADRWAPLDEAAPAFSMPATVEEAFAALGGLQSTPTMALLAAALGRARSPAELARSAGVSPRTLQRWFESHVGQPPRSYLRMVRFGEAFAGLPSADVGLAGHAADHRFADQAHMAREFRALAGAPPRTARKQGRGPFMEPTIDRS